MFLNSGIFEIEKLKRSYFKLEISKSNGKGKKYMEFF